MDNSDKIQEKICVIHANYVIKKSNIKISRSPQQLQSMSEEMRPWKVRDASQGELQIVDAMIKAIDGL